MERGKAERGRSDNSSWGVAQISQIAAFGRFHLSSLSRSWEPWPSQFHSSLRRTGTSQTYRPLKAVECSGCRRWGMSMNLFRLLLSARAALTGHDGCYLPKNSLRLGRLRWVAHLSSGFVVAEATSRGVRYDKCFAIGKFSQYIFDRRLLSGSPAENNFASLLLFFLHSDQE